MTHCVSKVLFVFTTCVLVHLASTLPLRMRTHEVQKRDVSNSSIACAVKKLQEAVSHVEIERMVS